MNKVVTKEPLLVEKQQTEEEVEDIKKDNKCLAILAMNVAVMCTSAMGVTFKIAAAEGF